MIRTTAFVRRVLTLALAVTPVFLMAADWSQFRGPGSLGVSGESGLPTTWSDNENIVWKTKLPGPGSSSPITTENRILLTCYSNYGASKEAPGEISQLRRHLVCLDRSGGQILWDSTVEPKLPEQAYEGSQQQHGYASSTPVTDGQHVYVFFGRAGVYAFDLDGKQLWQTDVGSGIHIWGTATSPVLYENLLILNAAIESGALVALDKQTGREVWRAEGIKDSWGSPSLVDAPGGDQELVLIVNDQVVGFNPASGERLWWCPSPYDVVCTTPLCQNGIVYATGGRKVEMLAIRAGGRGDVTDSHVIWRQNVGSTIPSPVLYEGRIYDVDSRGITISLDAETGEIAPKGRVPNSGTIYASVLAADGKLYVTSREKGVFVLAADPQLEVLAHNELSSDESIFNGSPAVSRGELLIRSDQYLYAIGLAN